jgi:4,5-DOPA dioxygenase extradiol
MPALFIGHGSPMNTLERNRYTETWRALGRSIPRPRAVLVVSAHWYIGATAVTAMERPETIHDFYGFPRELFEFRYPAPGAPEIASEIAELLTPVPVGLDEEWGLDHGAWSVLAHLFPEADVPVLQLSIDARQPLEYHLELGARLAALREREILIVGSGNVVHNLRCIDRRLAEQGFDWAVRFDEAVAEIMCGAPGEILSVTRHPDFGVAVPSTDHFVPLVYIAGVAFGGGSPGLMHSTSSPGPSSLQGERDVRVLVRGCTFGSISMTCFGVGLAERVNG